MLKILSRNLDFVKFLELEVAEPGTELLQVHLLRPLVKHLFEMVSPLSQVTNVRFQCQLLAILREYKICFKSGLHSDQETDANTFIDFGNRLSEKRFMLTFAVCGKGTRRPMYYELA